MASGATSIIKKHTVEEFFGKLLLNVVSNYHCYAEAIEKVFNYVKKIAQ